MRNVVILFVGLLFAGSSAQAQLLSRGDLFGPGALPPMLSIEGGFGMHSEQGSYQAECDCEFKDQRGNGFLGNIMYELPLDYTWVIGVKGGIDFKKNKGSVLLREEAVIRDEANGDSLYLDTRTFDRVGEISANYIGFSPFIKYQFARIGPFIQAGPIFQFLVGSHYLHKRVLYSASGITFSNGSNEETLVDGPIEGAKSFRFAAQITAGYDVEISEQSLLAPMVTFEIPFTTIRDDLASNWKIQSLFASVAVKFRMD